MECSRRPFPPQRGGSDTIRGGISSCSAHPHTRRPGTSGLDAVRNAHHGAPVRPVAHDGRTVPGGAALLATLEVFGKERVGDPHRLVAGSGIEGRAAAPHAVVQGCCRVDVGPVPGDVLGTGVTRAWLPPRGRRAGCDRQRNVRTRRSSAPTASHGLRDIRVEGRRRHLLLGRVRSGRRSLDSSSGVLGDALAGGVRGDPRSQPRRVGSEWCRGRVGGQPRKSAHRMVLSPSPGPLEEPVARFAATDQRRSPSLSVIAT